MAAAFSRLLPSKQSFYIMENTNKMSGNLLILLLAIVKADAYSTVDKNILFSELHIPPAGEFIIIVIIRRNLPISTRHSPKAQ